MIIVPGQFNVKSGDPKANISTMLDFIEEAKQENADLIVFPELCVGGYLLGDLFRNLEYMKYLMEFNDQIKEASNDISVAFGNVYADPTRTNQDGRFRLYNAVYVYTNGKENTSRQKREWLDSYLPKNVTVKSNLPNYRFFDDKRYFFSMTDLAHQSGRVLRDYFCPFEVPTKNNETELVGFTICEDMWYNDYHYRDGFVNPTEYLADEGATLICNSSASPWTIGKERARDKRILKLFSYNDYNRLEHYLYVNCIGIQNNGKNIITFDEDSALFNTSGQIRTIKSDTRKIGSDFTRLDVYSTTQDNINIFRDTNKSPIETKLQAITNGLLGFKQSLPKGSKVVIGLSGGVDSALVAYLCTTVFGHKNVIGINMPTKYNSEETQNSAKKLAKSLNIEYRVIPIENMIEANRLLMGEGIPSVVEENIQAKIRATSVLSNIAQAEGEKAGTCGIFTNNSNKLEIALGYSTLYGDWGGAISPIGDLTKAEVYDMCHLINQRTKNANSYSSILKIPDEILPSNDGLYQFSNDKIRPSAELKDDQTDPIKVGYHCAILNKLMNYKKFDPSDILEWYSRGIDYLAEKLDISVDLLKLHNLTDPEVFTRDLRWFITTMRKAVAKRVQSVPVIVTSKTAFGYDLRESILPSECDITTRYAELEKEILMSKLAKIQSL